MLWFIKEIQLTKLFVQRNWLTKLVFIWIFYLKKENLKMKTSLVNQFGFVQIILLIEFVL